jgi:hypothetical protein
MLLLHIPAEKLIMLVEICFFVNTHHTEMNECSSCDDKLPQFTKSHEKKILSILSHKTCMLLLHIPAEKLMMLVEICFFVNTHHIEMN